MLIGNSSNKSNLKMVRRIKRTLHRALNLPEEAIITVTQLTCLEKGCAPLETVIGLLQPERPQRQHKIHKAIEAINTDDLKKTCDAWGLDTQINVIDSFFKEI